jgi:hypothetical protein
MLPGFHAGYQVLIKINGFVCADNDTQLAIDSITIELLL